jgi:hypothetical protein
LVGICSKPVGAPNKPANVPDNQITQPGAVSTVRLVNQMVLFGNQMYGAFTKSAD